MSARLAPSSRPLPLLFVAFLSFFVFPLAFTPLGNKRHHHQWTGRFACDKQKRGLQGLELSGAWRARRRTAAWVLFHRESYSTAQATEPSRRVTSVQTKSSMAASGTAWASE